jgi:prepilin-type N-terminal cleavage/methylation domain-containing protein
MRRGRSGPGGFTILEIMVVVAVIGIVALMGLPALQNMILRSKHEGAARQISMLMHRAKMESVKQSVSTVVAIDPAAETVIAFADVNDDGDFKFDPDAGADYRTTDYQIGGTYSLPSGIDFAAHDGTDNDKIAEGFFDVTWSDTNVAIFESDGSSSALGAFRTGDLEGNYLEIRVEPQATARVEIRKWDGAEYLAQGDKGKTWDW